MAEKPAAQSKYEESKSAALEFQDALIECKAAMMRLLKVTVECDIVRHAPAEFTMLFRDESLGQALERVAQAEQHLAVELLYWHDVHGKTNEQKTAFFFAKRDACLASLRKKE